MTKGLPEKTTSIKLHADWLDRLDALTKLGGISRHQLMKNMIDVCLGQFTTIRALGFFKVGIALRDIQAKFGKTHVWKITGEEKSIPITMTETELNKIDRYAEECDLTRSQFLRNLIYIGIEEVELFEKLGAFKIEDASIRINNALKQIIQNGQRALKALDN